MASGPSATAWLSRVDRETRPIYAAIAAALASAIRDGELQPGDRLPAQRLVAGRLGVDLTTVTRAYTAAADQGLLEGNVGRGSFVRRPPDDDDPGLVDLSMNLPPPPDGVSLGALLGETLDSILRRTDAATLMAYHPEFGSLGQRRAAAEWLAPFVGERSPDGLLVSPGAQAALAATLSVLCRPGDTVVSEPLTYPGFRQVAAQLGLRIIACPSDDDGPLPAALADLCARHRPAAAYLIPTMQNPTALTSPLARRRELADVLRGAGVWLVEDDPYSPLLRTPLPAISSLAGERSIYIGTLAKSLSPGLRIAFVACPSAQDAQRIAAALRAVALMPAPLMAALATAWIREGKAATLLKAVRAEAVARRALAAERLPAAVGSAESLHVWLPLPPGASAEPLREAAQRRGLALVTHEAFAVGPTDQAGVRISLGGPGRRAVLANALTNLAEVVAGTAPGRRAVV